MVWQVLKDEMAWQDFGDLAALQARVVSIVECRDVAMPQSLTAYPFYCGSH
jgi:hypothetical protein